MDTKTKIKAIDRAIVALKDATKFTDMGFAFEGDVFGIHHNDAMDALDDYANAIADLRALRDAVLTPEITPAP